MTHGIAVQAISTVLISGELIRVGFAFAPAKAHERIHDEPADDGKNGS
jgi:hypothetical protein